MGVGLPGGTRATPGTQTVARRPYWCSRHRQAGTAPNRSAQNQRMDHLQSQEPPAALVYTALPAGRLLAEPDPAFKLPV